MPCQEVSADVNLRYQVTHLKRVAFLHRMQLAVNNRNLTKHSCNITKLCSFKEQRSSSSCCFTKLQETLFMKICHNNICPSVPHCMGCNRMPMHAGLPAMRAGMSQTTTATATKNQLSLVHTRLRSSGCCAASHGASKHVKAAHDQASVTTILPSGAGVQAHLISSMGKNIHNTQQPFIL